MVSLQGEVGGTANVVRFCESFEKKMKSGLFTILVLHAIGSSNNPIHGYRITKRLSEVTDGEILIQSGTIYPILRHLEEEGLVVHTRRKSTKGPPRKCYNLTDEGRVVFHELDELVVGFLGAVEKVRCPDGQ